MVEPKPAPEPRNTFPREPMELLAVLLDEVPLVAVLEVLVVEPDEDIVLPPADAVLLLLPILLPAVFLLAIVYPNQMYL